MIKGIRRVSYKDNLKRTRLFKPEKEGGKGRVIQVCKIKT